MTLTMTCVYVCLEPNLHIRCSLDIVESYALKKEGKCALSLSKETCKSLVKEMKKKQFKEVKSRGYPPGCYIKDSVVYFNNQDDSPKDCTTVRTCVCKASK